MHQLIVILISLSFFSLISLCLTNDVFSPIEIITTFMISSELITQIFGIIIYNFEWITFSKEIPVFWVLVMSYLIIIPCTTVWVLYLFFKSETSLATKAYLTIVWIVLLLGLEVLYHRLGFVTGNHRKIEYSILLWIIVLFGSFCFVVFLRFLRRKEPDT